MKICIVIPHYNHHEQLPEVLEKIVSVGLPVIVVDDGSSHVSVEAVTAIVAMYACASLVCRTENGGKGAAVKTGIRTAAGQGYSHALQIDADGQHDLDDIPAMLAMAKRQPLTLISGAPRFSDDMPASRRWGRRLTHACVALECLSTRVGDAMCGFRVYPLASIVALLDRHSIGDRMDFDIALMVKADWAGIPIAHFPTDVSYPEHGVSHFHYLRDNVLITTMHTGLILGMLPRAPALIWRHFKSAN